MAIGHDRCPAYGMAVVDARFAEALLGAPILTLAAGGVLARRAR